MTRERGWERFVALLRGINVGGVRIRMEDLADALRAIGLREVRTVLASGNVVFDAEPRDDLHGAVEAALSVRFGYPARVVLTRPDLVRAAVEAFPFDPADDTRQPYVLFGSDPAALAELAALGPTLDPTLEQIAAGPDVLYWHVQTGATTKSAFGKALTKVRYQSTTNRNLRTLHKILALA